MEQGIIITDTRYTSQDNDGTFEAVITDAKEFPNTLQAYYNLNTYSIFLNNKEVICGKLALISKRYMKNVDQFIESSSGHLFISAEDSKNYSIDSDGHLIYTYR